MGARVKRIVVEKTMADKREISVVFNYCAIHFIVGGFGFFNGKRLGRGEGFVCEAGQLCNYYPDKDEPWEYIWVIVDNGLSGFSADKESGYVFNFERCDELRALCLEFSENQEKLSDTKYSEAVFCILESYRTDFSPERDYGSTELVDKAERYMKEHIFESEAIIDVAAFLHISGGYLRYLFNLRFGKSPKQYLNSLRISRAEELLKSTAHPICRIASSVGYDDAQAFSKFFKKHLGATPLEYRRKSREK